VPENWLIVPEGNTKTTSLGGFAVYLLEHRHRAWIPWAASSRDQAEIGYRQAEGFVLSSKRLDAKLRCYGGYRRIEDRRTKARLQIFAADDGHADGIIPTDAFLDELHRHKNLRLYRTWRGKLLKRGGQIATISTAGEPGGEFEETRERIRQETPIVATGPGFVRCRSEHVSLHEWAVPEGADFEDLALVKAANPFSAITVEQLGSKRATPTMTVEHWRRFVCNLPTRSSSAAIQEAEWYGALSDERIEDGEQVWLGADFGFRHDTTAIVPLWWRDDSFRLLGDTTILVPPEKRSLDVNLVKRAFLDYAARYRVDVIVLDINRAEDIAQWLDEELGVLIVDRAQTSKPQSEDFERFMAGLRGGVLWHTGDAGLRRHALNAVERLLPDGGSRFARSSESREGNQDARVIDALVAAAMVHSYAVEKYGVPDTEPMFAWG
jgi:phage terminase large subunit-like protein